MSIDIRDLNKRFGKTVVCDQLNLSIPSGELVALLGPSGSGKTSLLRIIAGLERPNSGSVHFHGEDATFADVRERNVGFVFQHYALFAHMSIFENVAFGLRVRPKATRPTDAEIRRKVTELLELVQLDLGDVNPFHGRLDHAPGGVTAGDEVSYVRPHELDIVRQAEAGTLAVTLSQTLTVGPNTRIEFKRQDDGSYVDVELPRAQFAQLREQLNLVPGTQVHLKPRRVTRFVADAAA